MNYLLDALLFGAGVFVGLCLLAQEPKWSYFAPKEGKPQPRIKVGGEKYQFLSDEVERANERAGKLWP